MMIVPSKYQKKQGVGNIKIKDMFLDSLMYPSKDWTKVIVLGFISLFPSIGISTGPFWLLSLILAFIPAGYLFRIIKITFEGSDDLPDFNGWRKMFFEGFKVCIVALIYAIPLMIISIIPFIGQSSNISISLLSAQTLWGILTSPVQTVVFFLIILIEFIGIANMALYDGDLEAAFNFREIFERISMIGWREYTIFYILILILGLLTELISFVAFTVILGIIVVPLLIAPYFAMIGARFLALIFASSES